MSHIEFFGPPGAGKSTIYSTLIDSDTFYGGTEEDAVRRWFIRKANRRQRILYRLLPWFIRQPLDDEFLEYRLGYNALEDFIQEYPEFINKIHYAMNAVSYEPEKVFSLTRRSVERYQLGISTATDQEVLCLDEGFIQRALSILWREPSGSFSIDEFLQTLPLPNILIYVTAPPELCLTRQQERNSVAVEKRGENIDILTAQKNIQKQCQDFIERISEGFTIVKIKNTGSVKFAIEKILSELPQTSIK